MHYLKVIKRGFGRVFFTELSAKVTSALREPIQWMKTLLPHTISKEDRRYKEYTEYSSVPCEAM